MRSYEDQWPGGFHDSLSKRVKTIAGSTKHQSKLRVGSHSVNTEFIYAQVIAIMASSRENKLAPQPTALFCDDGQMRTTSKAVLKNKLIIQQGKRNREPSVVTIIDGCALLWTVSWPTPPSSVCVYRSFWKQDTQQNGDH